ncbi:MAG: DUF6157 family protein [Anaerolineae bacterium]|nr:DUF6157 family protein [Anaerolineae bacterium]
MSYKDTFIQIAPDSDAEQGVVPQPKGDKKPAHLIQYELLMENPYRYTHEDLVYEVYIRKEGFSEAELAERGPQIRAELFQKGHPCLRASALTKQYGWGAHYNDEGKIALYPVESETYQHFVETLNGTRNLLSAMRRKRA